MTNRPVHPDGIAPPAANYAPAMVTEARSRILHTSGIVPVAPDGSTPIGVAAQAAVVWASIRAILDEAGMATADIVSVTTYVVSDAAEHLGDVMAARDAALDGHLAASTLVTVPRLARAEWLVEVSVIAAVAADR